MGRTYQTNLDLDTLDGSTQYANAKGNHECVALVQQTTQAPLTAQWTQGKKVLECAPGEIAVGTVIATFDENGKYPAEQRHAALYEGHDPNGIRVVDQWNKQAMARRRTIRMKDLPERNINDAKWYYIVESEA